MDRRTIPEPQKGQEKIDPLQQLSNDSLLAEILRHSRELIRRLLAEIIDGYPTAVSVGNSPLPFSRAEVGSYLRIVDLWNVYCSDVVLNLPPRNCPACKSENHSFLFKSYDMYPYHSCGSCGMWFVPLRVDDSVTQAFFEAVPEARELSDKMMSGRDDLTRISDRTRIGTYFDILRTLVASRDKPISYIDIGCGVGHSVELAKEIGWQALGVELNEVAVSIAKQRGRNVVQAKDWDDDHQYDFVSMFETLEHITDPDQVIAQAARLLAPGGFLIITVPNRSSLDVSLLRERCFHVFGGSENVGHINMFDCQTLEVLLRHHGLTTLFTDGQYGSNILQIVSQLIDPGSQLVEASRSGVLEYKIPQPLYFLINNLGPAIAAIERAQKKSPILMAIACRAADEDGMKPFLEALLSSWRQNMRELAATI